MRHGRPMKMPSSANSGQRAERPRANNTYLIVLSVRSNGAPLASSYGLRATPGRPARRMFYANSGRKAALRPVKHTSPIIRQVPLRCGLVSSDFALNGWRGRLMKKPLFANIGRRVDRPRANPSSKPERERDQPTSPLPQTSSRHRLAQQPKARHATRFVDFDQVSKTQPQGAAELRVSRVVVSM